MKAFSVIYNNEFSQKLFGKNLKLPETVCTISRYAPYPPAKHDLDLFSNKKGIIQKMSSQALFIEIN